METREKILVTSALPYANGPLHLGHLAGAYLPADIYVRYQRLKKRDVIFICGSDEHGVPITIAAERQGVSPQEIVDRYHYLNKASFEKVGMSFDNYSRTSLPLHHKISQEFFLKLHAKGYLSEKTVTQLYCEHCGRFLADRYVEGTCPICHAPGARGDQCDACGRSIDQIQLINPICVTCGNRPVIRETRHWFLNLKSLQPKIKAWLDTKTHWKENVKNFCAGWFKTGLEDRAVTRDLRWGVPVPLPGYEDKVLYVWFDAPIGYISSTVEWAQKIGQPDKWKEYWQDSSTRLIHFIGKDNIVFHAIIWPLILMGHGDYILPDNIPANEYLNLEGNKISTSRNYAVWLDEYLAKFPADPLRYCLAANAPETKDADFSWKEFQQRNNNELADILGNFINRSLTFLKRHFHNAVPTPGPLDELDREMLSRLAQAPEDIGNLFENFEVRKAVAAFMDLARFANKYFNDQQPWITVKQQPEKCATTFYVCAQVLKGLAILMEPVLPFSARELWQMLNMSTPLADCRWEDAGQPNVPIGHRLNQPKILFNKLEDEIIEAEIKKLQAITNKSQKKTEEPLMLEKIPYEQFQKVELRVATVVEAEKVEKADKLLKMKIDLGNEQRTIVAGIALHYTPEQMIGKQIVVVANLEPAKIRGIESNGMLLAAVSDDQKLSLIVPEKLMPNGTAIH
ncbi:MAG: methionine--tRNA ligase [candidate division KSB1 bacterium]|nr:methionine--tRNA ligase [candidate division KSB1 bacterium]MDZ7334236.1 methionine--tRNA ligase [candidate division KSB1 bacterium]MDZ7356366.1 methionine--tRNA ligase [candidate division KSB1 bacterium]MDZ7401058.1 methionine--tRNA ligase [candidate division KSB1 bacterium]